MYRRGHKLNSDLFDELIVDNFAGGGGASMGIELAIGRAVDIAINHDPEAVAMHQVNHPHTRHLCEDVWSVDPVKLVAGRRVGLAWFSPDCTHFSKARGSKPAKKNIRGLAWVVIRWAVKVRPRVIALENVEEFTTWGPLDSDGRPCPKRKGRTFRSWIGRLRNLGYDVQWRELKACEYGAPTIRKRLFLIARCDGLPIRWPEKTHGPKKSGLKKYRTAAECIDWSIPCPSIFERKKPLAEKTLQRIARGIVRFVINAKEPFIVWCNHGGDHFRGQSVNKPLSTLTASRDARGVVVPYVTKFRQNSIGSAIDDPLHTITAGGAAHAMGLVSPVITKICQNGSNGGCAKSADDPLTTIVSKNEHCLITPVIAGVGGRAGQSPEIPGDKPLGTITAKNDRVVVAPVLVPRYGERKGQKPRSRKTTEPLPTIVPTQNGASLISATLVGAGGPGYGGKPRPVDEPLGTQTAENHRALCSAFLAKHYSGVYGHGVDQPTGTVTTKDHHSLVTSNLVKLRGTCKDGQPVTEPMPTLTAGGNHVAEVRAFLLKYYGTAVGQMPDEPSHTVTAKHRLGLVTVKGEDYQIVDIGMRMLTPRELYRAQGFPENYIIDPIVKGKPLTKSAQVRMCGNSVCPPVVEALVRVNMLDTDLDTKPELSEAIA